MIQQGRHWRAGWAVAALLSFSCGGRNESIGTAREERDDDPDAQVSRADAAGAPVGQDAQAHDAGLGQVPDINTVGDASAAGADSATDTPEQPSTAPDEPCADGLQPTSQLRRLTRRQYDRTIRDLLGLRELSLLSAPLPSDWLPPEHTDGLNERDWVAYQGVAKAIAEQVVNDSALLANYVECELEEPGCLNSTVSRFGRRAFRRPLTADEVESFERLLAAGADAPAKDLAQALLQTFLISPSFIQRAEMSEDLDSEGQFTLSSHETASRLSYVLWGSMPDERLDTLADADELRTAAQIQAEARRMLEDDKAVEMVTDFHRDALSMGPNGMWTFPKDAAKFPEYTDAVREAMSVETERFFQRVVFGEGTFADLFQSRVGFVNANTAPLYGLDPAGFGLDLQEVELAERPGFLTRIGFLSAYSYAGATSILHRGGFVLNEVLGYDLAPLPSVVAGDVPELLDLDTNRGRVAAQTSGPDCKFCHDLINPPGFVLEAFDAIGRLQTVEADTGAAINTAADVFIDRTVTSISGPEALMEALANSRDARTHYARRWVNYAYERVADAESDGCAVSELSEKLSTDGYTLLQLVADLTQTAQFRARTLELP